MIDKEKTKRVLIGEGHGFFEISITDENGETNVYHFADEDPLEDLVYVFKEFTDNVKYEEVY